MDEPPSLPPQEGSSTRAQELLAECLELPTEAQDEAVERLCREHPDLADTLRKAYGFVREAGLIGDPEFPALEEDPAAQSGVDSIEIVGLRILEKLGSGGMGDVWLAEQLEPVRRKVAVKLVQRGMASHRILARFEIERQALARMSHPCIAQVFGAGVTTNGAPYFLMEYVSGTPFHGYCDGKQLGIDERLELFIKVCEGVQHAHQRGIIHRDLKPSNVLVIEYQGKPTPKIIDFGVAKAIEEKLTDETMYTEYGVVIGTPEYMSPEQAAGDPGDIDTRTDVYALGVILYELLTGALPFDSKDLRNRSPLEIVEILRETSPPKPSTKVGSFKDDSTTLALCRGTTPTSLARKIRGDLDWIVMKAMEKDRERRYESAAALAADVERYRKHEPVEAGPPSKTYRLRKMVRKHRGLVVATLSVFVALVLGLAATLWQAKEARANMRLAQSNEREARALALANASTNAIATRPEVALQLAWESHRLDETWQSRSALHAALLAAHEYKRLPRHRDPVWSAVFSPDGSRCATFDQHCTIHILDAHGTLERTLRMPADPETKEWKGGKRTEAVFASNTRIVTACTNGRAYLWDINEEAPVRRFEHRDSEGNTVPVMSVAVMGEQLLTGDRLGVIRLWSLQSDAPLRSFLHREAGRQQYVNSIAFNPDPNAPPHAWAASASQAGTVRLWSRDGKSRLLPGPVAFVGCVRFSPDGRYLARGDPGVILYDLRDMSARSFSVQAPVWSVRFSPPGEWEHRKWILIGTSASSIHLVDLDGTEIGTFVGHADQVSVATFSPDCRQILSGCCDGTVRLWELQDKYTPSLLGHTDVVRSASFAPDGQGFITSSADGTVRQWGPEGEAEAVFHGSGSKDVAHNMRWAIMGPGNRLYACSDEGGLVWWDEHRRRHKEPSTMRKTMSLALSCDRRQLAVGTTEGVGIFDVSGSEPVRKTLIPQACEFVAFSPNGQRLLAIANNRAQLWSTATAGTLDFAVALDATYLIKSGSFSGDGNTIVTASSDRYLRTWPGDGAKQPLFEKLHPGGLTYAGFDPQSSRILTTCRDRIARLWTKDGEKIMELRGHKQVVWRGAWSPDGKRVITASFDKTAQVWIADPYQLVRRVEARLENVKLRLSDLEPYRDLLGDRIEEIVK